MLRSLSINRTIGLHERADVQFEKFETQLPIFIDALRGTANGTHDQPREAEGRADRE
jgi:hypothetical protein